MAEKYKWNRKEKQKKVKKNKKKRKKKQKNPKEKQNNPVVLYNMNDLSFIICVEC